MKLYWRSARPAEYKTLVLKTGEEWKGQNSEIQIMPDGKKQKKKVLEFGLLVKSMYVRI